MNKAKRKYAKKCKSRIITFYLNEVELYNFSKTINFQQFVKLCLKCEIAEANARKNGDYAISLNEEDYRKDK